MGPLYTPSPIIPLSDVITLHAPLMPSTRNLIGAPSSRDGEEPLLINTARGGLVDEEALAEA